MSAMTSHVRQTALEATPPSTANTVPTRTRTVILMTVILMTVILMTVILMTVILMTVILMTVAPRTVTPRTVTTKHPWFWKSTTGSCRRPPFDPTHRWLPPVHPARGGASDGGRG